MDASWAQSTNVLVLDVHQLRQQKICVCVRKDYYL